MTYPTKKLWEICKLYQPKTISKKEMIDDWKFVVFWANWIIWRYNKFNHENEEILITCRWATCWSINISNKYSWINWNAMVSHIINKNELDFLYLFYCFKYIDFSKVISGSAQPQITRIWLVDLNIPIPPLSTQKLIVKKLDSAFKNIDESIKITKKNIENIEELNKSSLDNVFKDRNNLWIINDALEYLTDYHANGSYKTLKENVELKDNKDYALMVRATDLEKNNFIDWVKYLSEYSYNYLTKTKVYWNEIILPKIWSR
jgi:type I restriction enzyme S subunit